MRENEIFFYARIAECLTTCYFILPFKLKYVLILIVHMSITKIIECEMSWPLLLIMKNPSCRK